MPCLRLQLICQHVFPCLPPVEFQLFVTRFNVQRYEHHDPLEELLCVDVLANSSHVEGLGAGFDEDVDPHCIMGERNRLAIRVFPGVEGSDEGHSVAGAQSGAIRACATQLD